MLFHRRRTWCIGTIISAITLILLVTPLLGAKGKQSPVKTKKNYVSLPKKSANKNQIIKHKVRSGETLCSIGRLYGVNPEKIKACNKLRNGQCIQVGDVISVPVDNVVAVSKTTNQKENNDYVSIKNPVKCSAKSSFNWPVKRIINVNNDGADGVKSIGIYISASPGTPVQAAASGVVKKVDHLRGYGDFIIVRHDNGYMTVYSNVSNIKVRAGQRVSAGSIIAYLAPSDSRLHFQINKEGKPQNPLAILPRRES